MGAYDISTYIGTYVASRGKSISRRTPEKAVDFAVSPNGVAIAGHMSMKTAILTILLTIISIVFGGYVLNSNSSIFSDFHASLLSVQWMLLICIAVWCGFFIFLDFDLHDLPLIGMLLIAIAAFFMDYAVSLEAADAIVLLSGATLGKSAFVLLRCGDWKNDLGIGNQTKMQFFVGDEVKSQISKPEKSEIRQQFETPHLVMHFLIGLIVLLTISSWWHLEVAQTVYPGTRWTGLWNNPNIYGMLMGAGMVLIIGLFVGERRWQMVDVDNKEQKAQNGESRCILAKRNAENGAGKLLFAAMKSAVGNWQPAMLFIAAGMMTVGWVMSYSRGAWVATVGGFFYLAWCYGKLKLRLVLPVTLAAAAVGCVFWHATADNDPWYLKRLDCGRPSAQHRVSAWFGALQMMKDHPLGVGWNQAVGVYEEQYSPPDGGAAALTMNSYLMLGTELGIPALLCFVAYAGLALRTDNRKQKTESLSCERISAVCCCEASQQRCACRAGAVVLLVAFWFDGGLYNLPTATTFWILLELGNERVGPTIDN